MARMPLDRDMRCEDDPTIDVDAANILAAMIASARSRGDAASFAQVMDVALDMPALAASALAGQLDVAPASIAKWRNVENAPQGVFREVVMDELCAILCDLGLLQDSARAGDAERFRHDPDLAVAGRRAIARALRGRLEERSALEDTVFIQNMRAARNFGIGSLDAVMTRIDYSGGSLKRWISGSNLPNGLTRRAFNRALRDEVDIFLGDAPSGK